MPPNLAPRQPATDTEGRTDPRGNRADASPAASVHERVLASVAARICTATPARDDSPASCLTMLCDAVVTSDAALDTAFATLRRVHGLGDEDIVDCYIPAAACQLGDDWTENRRSFAEVTIGTARLIAAVRRLSERWAADGVADWRAPSMAMVVPEAEQHRLGAMIAASRFRRLGVSVQMLLGRPDAEVVACIHDGDFDFVSFSLATHERVEQTRRLIHMLRQNVTPLPPIVVGGAVGISSDEIKAQLGVDHVASDPEEALAMCGVSVPKRAAGRARAKT
ncbi:cobalamin B12-binding domain-containing protein [Rhodobaculum claviforme]|nr:cobalamin B12-binding domain-containing protein [Rhodobaculum claviforme]